MRLSWTFHNRVIHPIAGIMRFFGLSKRANRLHDKYMPAEINCILWDHDGMAGTIVEKKKNR